MKCIHCGVDSKYKDRTNGKCSGCHKRFAFEPKKGDPFTDGAFKAAIDAVSANGKVKWGVEHLYYELRRRKTREKWTIGNAMFIIIAALVTGSVLGGPTAILVSPASVAIFVIIMSAVVGGSWLSKRFAGGTTYGPSNDPTFDGWWEKWVSAHGHPQGLIVRKEQPKRPKASEPDIADYSFDRAVICDRARTVDLLVANNFHFENNCAILSIGGYPQGPFETIRLMLKRNPKLQVFALHDADVAGCRLAHRLATDPAWFKGQATVTDIGLRPRHAKAYRRLVLKVPHTHVNSGEGVFADEAKWLSESSLELAVVRPEQVLKRLFRAINRKEDAVADRSGDAGSSGSFTDGSSFSSDAGDSDGGADSFG